MENYDIKSRVYVLLDAENRVTRLEGEYSLPPDLTGWTLIEEGAPCDRLNLAQSHYLDPPLYTEDGLLAWKYEDGALALRTDEELEAERAAQPAPEVPPTNAELAASLASVQSVSIAAFVALAETQVLDNDTAAQHKDIFDEWAIGMAYKAGQLRRDPLTGLLYRCAQAHTAQAGWEPSLTPAMWTVVDVTHAGTLDDPIPAARGMEYEYGKHYLDPEDGAVYRCARTGEASGGKVTLQYLPHELVGQYFMLVGKNEE